MLTLVLFGVDPSQLVLGGALTTVFVSIAAQQALGNVFAGLVVMLARPFQVGDAVRLRAGALGGAIDGTVTDIGITYVRVDTGGGVLSVPNSQVLNAVVGPIPPAEEDNSPAPAVTDGKSGTPGGPEQPQPAAGTSRPATGARKPAAGRRQRADPSASKSPASVPALRYANRCGGRLSAKGTTRLQPNGIPRRQ